MPKHASDLGAKFGNSQIDAYKRDFRAGVDSLKADVLGDGYPQGSSPLTLNNQLTKLMALRDANDPRAYTPEAETALQSLHRRVGR